MKNTSDIVGLSFMDRLLGKIKNYSDILSYFGIGILSLLLSNSVLFSQIAPFGIALTACTSNDFTLSAVLGATIGYLIAPDVPFKMKYVACVLVIGAVKWAFSGKSGANKHNTVLSSILTGFVLGGVGLFVIMANHPTTYDFILLFSEVLLAIGATYFFTRTISIMTRSHTFPTRQSDISCVVITFGLMIVALCSFSLSDISFGRIAAVLVILICALKTGESGGAIGGITAGVAVCLSDSSFAFLMGSYGFGGLLAGVFSHFGRFGTAAAFIVTNGIATALAALVRPTTLSPVFEVFIASIIFVLIPYRFLQKIAVYTNNMQTISADSVKNIILNRLFFTRKALSEVAAITEQVSGKLQKLDKPPFDINAAVADRVCTGCSKKLDCWQTNFGNTSSALNDLSDMLRHGQALTIDAIPESLRLICLDPQGLIAAVVECCNEQRRLEIGFSKNVQLRSIVLDQWSGIEQLIGDISDEISRIAVQNEHTGTRIREYLRRKEIDYQSVSCYEDDDMHIIIELSIASALLRMIDKASLTYDFSEICDREFNLPAIHDQDGSILLVFYERAYYKLSCGVSQVCSTGKRLCGDSFKLLEENEGHSMIILSDGMGNGSLAAIDSSMATALISRLATANVGLEATLKLVNSAMLIKSGDESLATIDICTADLYKGSVTLYKAGAAPSYIKKSGRVGFVESSSLPAGILNSVEFEKTTLTLNEGDIVVMVSDGVTQTGEDWVLDELERFTGSDMQWLCERLASLAKLRRTELHDDDITVFAMMFLNTQN